MAHRGQTPLRFSEVRSGSDPVVFREVRSVSDPGCVDNRFDDSNLVTDGSRGLTPVTVQ